MERFDLLHTVHKALRHAMLTVDIESGRTDFADPDAVSALATTWSRLRENLGHHAEHEDEIIFPLLRDRAPGEVDELYEDHRGIQRIEAEMDALLERITNEQDPAVRRLLGREFHRSMQRYTATCLLHFDDEERHFMPRVWMLYEDRELVEAFERVMASVTPDEREYVMGHMAQALDPAELEEMRRRMPVAT